jgi:hypothetical protein
MKNLIVTISFGLITASAQSMVWQSDGTPQNIQFIHDNQATDGDTITLPAGAFTWSTHVTITKGITIQGLTTVNSDTGVCDDQTKLVDNLNPNYPGGEGYFHCTANAVQNLRITGLTFTGTGGTNTTKYNGAVRVGGNSTTVRFDHLHFDNLYHSNYVAIYGTICGVSDHVVESNLHGQWGQNRCFNGAGAGGFGDEVFAQPAGYGGPDFFFFEDWYADNRNSAPFSAAGGWDANNGGKYVVRHSQLWNIEILCHGTEGSREHGGRAYEIYNCAFHFNYYTGLDGVRSGTMLAHDNTYDGVKPVGFGLQTYRLLYGYGNTWKGATGANDWDYNVTEADGTHIDGHPSYRFETGSVTGWTNSGGNGTLTDGSKNWTAHRWRGYEVSRPSDGRTWAINDNTATTLSTVQWGDGCCIQNFANGDTYEIRKVLMANDQPGLGAGDLVSGPTPTPHWRHQVREGCYTWNNVYTPDGSHINWNPHVNAGVNGQLVEGLDYFSDTPMPGYTPYCYPHPLVSGVPCALGTPTPTPTPTETPTPTSTP